MPPIAGRKINVAPHSLGTQITGETSEGRERMGFLYPYSTCSCYYYCEDTRTACTCKQENLVLQSLAKSQVCETAATTTTTCKPVLLTGTPLRKERRLGDLSLSQEEQVLSSQPETCEWQIMAPGHALSPISSSCRSSSLPGPGKCSGEETQLIPLTHA